MFQSPPCNRWAVPCLRIPGWCYLFDPPPPPLCPPSGPPWKPGPHGTPRLLRQPVLRAQWARGWGMALAGKTHRPRLNSPDRCSVWGGTVCPHIPWIRTTLWAVHQCRGGHLALLYVSPFALYQPRCEQASRCRGSLSDEGWATWPKSSLLIHSVNTLYQIASW